MRFYRTLVAGVLALGVAACGDDVEIVEPTPPPPPPPPALSASMAPASAEVEVGSSVVFAVNVSGGVAGEAASWSCASSNTGIATASTTSAGCQATGVAAGGVTITATVSKGNETANVGSQLTVTSPPAPPPFEASIAPESQSVAVGSSVVFAVNTSGGYTGMMDMDGMMMAASWTCSSSDPAIATAETTDAGCQATGVSGGEVTINVAATDDHTTINLVAQLTVTTDPVDPVQPFSASMAPESATVAVGSDAVFAINTSGGAADATAEWTCSSSDDAIATAATTDAGCQATGVAAGGVTINAAVTKGEDNANLAAQLTVTAPDVAEPAFVLIASVNSGAPGPYSGSILVSVNVERGDQTLEALSLLVDGDEVATQPFGVAAAAPADGPAEQSVGVHTFVLSVNTAEYQVMDGIGHPRFPNGDHVISAQLKVAGSTTPVTSNQITAAFRNDDRLNLSLATDGNQAMDREGRLWNSGAVAGSVVPVMYSGDALAQVELVLQNQDGSELRTSLDDGDATLDDDEIVASIIDNEAPFEVTWENANAIGSNFRRVGGIEPGGIVLNIASSAFSDGSIGPTTEHKGDNVVDKSYFVRLDNKGPSVSNFNLAMQFNQHYDITNWVGASHAFTFSDDEDLTPDFSDAGVGRDRSHHQYYAGTSTAEGDWAPVSTPNDLDETPNDRAYVLRAAVQDLLGNETVRWWAGADDEDGRSNSSRDRGMVDRTDDYKFGVDLTAPTQELVEEDGNIGTAGVISNVAIATDDAQARRSVEIDYDDPGTGSGFSGSNAPVHTRIRRFAPNLSAEDGCISGQAFWYRTCEILGDPGSHQTARGGTTGSYDFEDQEDGYYAVEYAVMDDAGNRAPFIQVGGVIDEAAPVGNALVPAVRAIGGRSTLQAFASDNLDLDRVEFYLGFGTDAYQMGSESVGSPSLPFEQSANPSISIETLPAGVQSAAGAPPALSAHVVRILDQAGNPTYASAAVTATGDAPRDLLTAFVVDSVIATADSGTDGIGGQNRLNVYAPPTVENDVPASPGLCWDADGDGDCADNAEARATLTFDIVGTGTVADRTGGADGVTLEAEAPGNPFERVVFYVQRGATLTEAQNGVTTVWAYLGEGRGRAPQNVDTDNSDDTAEREFSWRLNVRGSDVAEAAGLTAVGPVNFRAVGYTDDGTAVTVADGANGTITLTDDS